MSVAFIFSLTVPFLDIYFYIYLWEGEGSGNGMGMLEKTCIKTIIILRFSEQNLPLT